MFFGYCWRPNHQINAFRYLLHIIIIMHTHPFGHERTRQFRLGAVIAIHLRAMEAEVAGQRRHADAANADEIDFFNCVEFHDLILYLKIRVCKSASSAFGFARG